MGLLSIFGQPMAWGTTENDAAIPRIIAGGVEQFVAAYQRCKDIRNMPFLWGDELEHQLVEEVTLEDGTTVVRLALNAAEVLRDLAETVASRSVDWRPEYGSWMVESVPYSPYSDTADSLNLVETNMLHRYRLLDRVAGPNRYATTLVTFPLMGVGNFTNSKEAFASPHSQSLFVPDTCINQTHPRFSTLTANIRKRRGRKVCIQVPLFIDTHTMTNTVDAKLNIDFTDRNKDIRCAADETAKKTSKFGAPPAAPPSPSKGSPTSNPADTMVHLYTPATDYYYAQYRSTTPEDKVKNVKQRYEACPCPTPSVTAPCVYMDCMAFGMGCDCLQVTMQLRDMAEARFVFDQLVCLCAPFLAITSATPFQKGLLCDSDVRWLTIAASVDDRKRSEVPRIIKSRYDSVSVFISGHADNVNDFNDNRIEIHQETYDRLVREGLDPVLAQHVAHMFIRDPLVIFDQAINLDNETRMDHFESIQSTNWQTVRFKPPPVDSNIGWRVEFRVMDIMPTPFENAAFSVFVALLTKAIVHFELFFYTKMSLVDENMGRAHARNPCNQKYVMRQNPFCARPTTDASEAKEMSVDEIFNGSQDFIGLIEIVRKYMRATALVSPQIDRYIAFIAARAAGRIPTVANYLRDFVTKHPDYKHDSRLTERIALDLSRWAHELALGKTEDPAFLPMADFGPVAEEAVPNGQAEPFTPLVGVKRARE